jgi:hypothetical protein
MLCSLPESPRWLYRHKRPDEALQVLCDVYDMAPDDPKVMSESSGILEAIELETLHGEYKWSQILKRDEVQTGKRVLLAYGIQFMNQMGGINLVVVSSALYVFCRKSLMRSSTMSPQCSSIMLVSTGN